MMRLKNTLTIICFFVLWGFNSFAAEEPYENFIKGTIKKNDSLFVKDEKFRNPNFRWSEITNIAVNNTLSLKILFEKEIAKNFNLQVTLRVAYFSSPEQVEPNLIDSVKLNVNYEKGKSYKGIDNYNFTNGYYVKVYVLDVQSPELGAEVPDIFQLTSSIFINRKYQFNPQMPLLLNGVMLKSGSEGGTKQRLSSSGPINNDTQLQLSWTPLYSGEIYDLEWVTLDRTPENETILNSLVDGYFSSNEAIIAAFFRNNSSRATTDVPLYTISLVSSADVILVRVRQVSYTDDGLRKEGVWSYKQDNPVKYTAWNIQEHEPNMNWQYAVSYAEEGKKKEVVTYFDGSLRGRQTVTLNNAENVALIQENIYDQYGRTAASILPAPAQPELPKTLHYFKKFNQNSGKAYNFSNLNFAFCETKPDILSTSSGSSLYYSSNSNNLFKNDSDRPFNALIPNAGGYPLSVTQYTADNTGRIKIQGGVGEAFQPGVANSRTTKYYYGKPDQWELDRVFGNDIGSADHYLKNMVIDANQQLSISYLNASGKTIATALAGKSPDNVEALGSLPTVEPDTIPLISPGMFTFKTSELTLTANTTYLVQSLGTGQLKYDVEQLISRYPETNFQPYSNCYYDLKIVVKDDCQEVVATKIEQVGSLTADPNKAGLHTGVLDVNFTKIGAYYVSFEFSLSRDVIQNYTREFIQKGEAAGAIMKASAFILKELREAKFEDCLSDCKTARAKLGSLATFKHMVNAKLFELNTDSNTYSLFIDTLHARLLQTVTALESACAGTGTSIVNYCDQYRPAMLADVSPGGQYALFDDFGNALEPSINALLRGFKVTVFQDKPVGSAEYQSTLITTEDGTTSPYANGFSLKNLVKYWRPEWAELFLPLHPENCKLLFCNENSNSNRWNENLKEISTDAGLVADPSVGVHYSSTNNSWLLDKDPFFSTGGAGVNYKTLMINDLTNYSTEVLKISQSQASIKSLSKYVDYQLYCADQYGTANQNAGVAPNNWENCNKKADCAITDREWQLYRDMYLELKQKYFEMAQNAKCACRIGSPIVLPPTVPGSNPCTNVIYLGASGTQESQYKFTRTEGITKYTYTLVNGMPGDAPNPGSICSSYASPIFYPCLTMTLADGNVRNFSNVWMFTCAETIAVSCNRSSYVFASGWLGGNTYYVNNSLDYRDTYFILEGFTESSPPPYDYCVGITNYQYWDCFTVYAPSGNFTYYNVWVRTCFDEYTGGVWRQQKNTVADNETTELKVPTSANVITELNFTDSDQKEHEVVIADVIKKRIYSVLTEVPDSSLAAGRIAIKKQNFSPYHFQESFTVQLANKAFRKFSNVWIASCLTRKEPVVEGKTLMNRSLEVLQPCLDSDFSISEVDHYGAYGVLFYIRYKSGIACPNDAANLRVFRNRDGIWEDIGTLFIAAGNVDSYSLLVGPGTDVFGPYDIYVACGTNPCTSGGPVDGCSPLLVNKKSRFEAVNRTDVSAQNPQQIRDDLGVDLKNLITSSCESGADVWMERLAPGLKGKDPLKVSLLRQKLIDLCSIAGDTAHVLGASSLPSGYILVNGVHCSNFGDVIKASLSPLPSFTPLLNPWLLDSPYPYHSGQQPVERWITNTNLDICNRLNILKGGLTDPTQIYNHLKTTFGSAMNMSFSDFEVLLKGCNNCRFLLSKDILLPQFLEPNSKACITKVELSAAMNALKAEFNNAISPDSANYETIVSNYLNFKWGFNLTFNQYQSFQGGSSELLCNETPYTTVAEIPYTCEKSLIEQFVGNGKMAYNAYIQEERIKFENAYIKKCASAQVNVKLLTGQQIYHYTLYYYDQAGNLVRTVPPEGVHILNKAEVKIVGEARRFKVDDFNYTGPIAESNKTAALNSLSTTLSYNGNAAVEMWLYQNNSSGRQMIVTTSDMKYMFQACINGNLLNIDVYSLQQSDPGSVSIVLSNHVTADITALQPILPWTHIVVQGNKLSAGGLQLWINGKLYPAVSGAPSAGCGWSINSVPTLVMPENISSLKHLRLYPGRLMSAAEIKANAENGSLSPQVNTAEWYRFGVPAAGSGTTIAGNSTLETQFNLLYPAHRLTTTYAYNSTNQVLKQESPDAGISRFWYDDLSRLVVSQNAKQAPSDKYSYTKYDVLGRIIEVGEKTGYNGTLKPQDVPAYLSQSFYSSFLASGSNSQLTQTKYDEQPIGGTDGVPLNLVQNNLRKRVSASIYRENAVDNNFNASYYDYDNSGNVKTLYQQVAGLGVKAIGYEYDLASGKVNFVSYQHGKPDQFYYGYKYDQENRLTEAWSSIQANVVSYGIGSSLNPATKKLDATYQYYLHGPLARMTLGNLGNKVQGLDYAYTLQGWLKGVNGNTLRAGNTVGGDVMAYSLGYYPGDYSAIGGSSAYSMQWQPGGETGKALYNGNISNSTVAIKGIGNDLPSGYTYGYDQLNRLVKMRQHDLNNTTTVWNSGNNVGNKYKEDYTYDGNGNILTLKRNGAGGQLMDDLNYAYHRDGGNNLVNNKLVSVGGSSYTYDSIGNLIKDSTENISSIDWTVYGKIKTITKNGQNISYTYDPGGNRVSKTSGGITTWYVRDAQGNPLGVYDNNGGVYWREQQLYGSSRLGMWRPDTTVVNGAAAIKWDRAGKKSYELSNHLGNVLAVVSDKFEVGSNGPVADLLSAQDYYPFGMIQPGRSISSANYRYGFNGKENDNEVKKDANGNDIIGAQQDYGMRIYDPRVGRFLSVDPLTKEYPALTPYQFASNSPIAGKDRDGLEFEPYWTTTVPPKIRKYESDLRKNDPKHADAIIRQHNIDAFLFVGGAATGGAGRLATFFWDAVMFWGGTQMLNGILTKNDQQTLEGAHIVANAAMGEVLGAAIGQIVKSGRPVILDFFGGETSQIKGALNIDPAAAKGFKGTIEEFVQIAKKNNITGKVDAIIANNPYGYADYIADAAQLLKKDGTITVSGTYGNKYFKQVAEGKAKGLSDFDVIQGPTKVSDKVKGTMRTSEGEKIKGDVYQIILKKK